MELISIICSSISTKDFVKMLVTVLIIGLAIMGVVYLRNEIDGEPIGCIGAILGVIIGLGVLIWLINWMWDLGWIG